MRRHLRAAAGAFVLAGATVAWAATPASATDQPGLTVAAGKDAKQHYGPIAGQGQVTQLVAGEINDSGGFEPSNCDPTFCDTIPVKVTLPADYTPETYYETTSFTLSWTGSNDMDIYAFYKGKDKDGKEKDMLAGSSAGSSNPEKGGTEQLDYTLYVLNSSGADTGGYDILLHLNIEKLEMPQEAPEKAGGGFGTPFPSSPQPPIVGSSSPFPSGGGAPSVPASGGDLGGGAPVVPVAPATPIDDEPSASRSPALEPIDLVGGARALGAGDLALAASGIASASKPIAPASTAAIVGTLVVVPGTALLGVGATVGLRRRRLSL